MANTVITITASFKEDNTKTSNKLVNEIIQTIDKNEGQVKQLEITKSKSIFEPLM